MAILTAMQSASIRLVGRKPGTFFGAPLSAVFEMEIADFINEVAQDITKYQDWAALTVVNTLTSTGDTDYALPSDYSRQLIDADIQLKTAWAWGYTHFTNINDFIFQQNSGWVGTPGGWIIYGGKLRFSPAPVGDSQFPYITKNWALAQDGTSKGGFSADTDTFLLPERLLTLGLVWRWRENKKLDASGDQEAFIKALDEYAGKDAGSSIIRFNGSRRWPGASVPYMGYAV